MANKTLTITNRPHYYLNTTVTIKDDNGDTLAEHTRVVSSEYDLIDLWHKVRKDYENVERINWRDNDVVAVEFPRSNGTTNGKKYTYIRREGYWPGDASWSLKTDDEITELWHDGHVQLLARDGEPWDQAARP